MKRITALSLLAFLAHTAHAAEFMFTDHKQVTGDYHLTYVFLKQVHDTFSLPHFVETGTFLGGSTAQAGRVFSHVHTIELDKRLAQQARNRFAHDRNITVYEGDSAQVIYNILPQVHDGAVFWLDAHFSGGGTAKAQNGETPISQELKAIKEFCPNELVILIDDIGYCGTRAGGKEFIGNPDYPFLDDVCNALLEINPDFNIALISNILLAYDKKYSVPYSPISQACTTSRMYDGSTISDNTLLEAEKIISKATGEEKSYIKRLCAAMKKDGTKDFHYSLWQGLLLLGEQNYGAALRAFKEVTALGYDHPRVREYSDRAQALMQQ